VAEHRNDVALHRDIALNGRGTRALSLHFRPQAIRKLPMEQRAKRARSLIEANRSTPLAWST